MPRTSRARGDSSGPLRQSVSFLRWGPQLTPFEQQRVREAWAGAGVVLQDRPAVVDVTLPPSVMGSEPGLKMPAF